MDVRPAQGPVQITPDGLLGLLDLLGRGVVPNSIAGFVQPTLDMGQFYFNAQREILRGYAQGAAASNALYVVNWATGMPNAGTPLSVPMNEVWCVERASLDYRVPDANDTVESFGICYSNWSYGQLSQQWLCEGHNRTANGQPTSFIAMLDRPVWLRGGDTLFMLSNYGGATPPDGYVSLQVTRMARA